MTVLASWSTAYPRRSVASGDSARTRARWCAIVVAGPVEPVAEGTPGPLAQGLDLVGPAASSSVRGSARRGPGPQRRRAGAARGRASRAAPIAAARAPSSPMRSSSATSGTTRLAASVGVEARTSATRSSSGESGSWPIAETTGVRHVVHGPDQRLVGERQQVLDRAAAAGDDDHVDGSVAVEAARPPRSPRPRRACPAWRRTPTSKRDRGPAPPGVLEHVALGGGVGRGDQADRCGQERQRALELGGEQTLGGQQLAAALEPGEQLAHADQPDLADVERERAAVGVERRLRVARRSARPRPAAWCSESKTAREQVTGIEMSATVSRRVRKTVFIPARRLIWVTWPSTQTAPSRSTHRRSRWAIWRTGAGCSGEVSRAMAASLEARHLRL